MQSWPTLAQDALTVVVMPSRMAATIDLNTLPGNVAGKV
jgi:hypothetical protein